MSVWPEPCAALAAHGLPGATLALPDAPLDDRQWGHLMSCVVPERISGLLAQTIADGMLPVTSRQADEAAAAHRASMIAAVLLERTLLRTAALFDAAGIDFRVLKGSAVAHLDYPDPSLRSFGDNDLLVRSSDFDAAVAALVTAAHHRKFPEPRPGFDRRFGKGSCLVAANGYEIDLHRTLAMGPFGLWIRLDDLWSSPSTFVLAGRTFAALAPEVRFLHACFHAVLGDRYTRLASLRDVAQMQRGRPLDIDGVLEISAAWRAQAVVARALRMARDVFGLVPVDALDEWAQSYAPSSRELRALAVYRSADPTYAGKSFAAVPAIPGLRDKLAFVYALAFPTRQYRQERQEPTFQRWQRGAKQIGRALRARR
jgi:putative nucleotidyltransferase-like protein